MVLVIWVFSLSKYSIFSNIFLIFQIIRYSGYREQSLERNFLQYFYYIFYKLRFNFKQRVFIFCVMEEGGGFF